MDRREFLAGVGAVLVTTPVLGVETPKKNFIVVDAIYGDVFKVQASSRDEAAEEAAKIMGIDECPMPKIVRYMGRSSDEFRRIVGAYYYDKMTHDVVVGSMSRPFISHKMQVMFTVIGAEDLV